MVSPAHGQELNSLPSTPLTPSLSIVDSIESDSAPRTPASMNILLDAVDVEPRALRDDRTDSSSNVSGSELGDDDTIRLLVDPHATPTQEGRYQSSSEGVEGEQAGADDDMFPSTASHESQATRQRVDQIRPPQPAHDPSEPVRITSGPPVGWRSTIPASPPLSTQDPLTQTRVSPVSGEAPANAGLDQQHDLRRSRETFIPGQVNSRLSMTVKGRTVSGAMQHAMHRVEQTDQASDSAGYKGPGERPSSFDLQSTTTSQQDEEIWMSYVRDQLAALFPDFFDPSEYSSSHDGGSSAIMAQARSQAEGIARDEVAQRLDSNQSQEKGGTAIDIGWNVIQDRGHRRALTSNRVPSVTNVKSEIGGMKDEIERL